MRKGTISSVPFPFLASILVSSSFGAEIRVHDTLSFVGLTDKKNHNALTLSSGETQRLGIVRALIIEPEILFLDEPTASVDQKNTDIIEDIILKMKRERKTTVIITTHDRAQAERLADFLLVMKEGRIVTDSPPLSSKLTFPCLIKMSPRPGNSVNWIRAVQIHEVCLIRQ